MPVDIQPPAQPGLLEKNSPEEASSTEEPPDGGYGWVVVFAILCANSVRQVNTLKTKIRLNGIMGSWGFNSCFGVFLSYYLANDVFPGATPLEFAFVGGLSISQGLMVAPLANWLTRRYHFKVPIVIGTLCLTLGQVFAGLSTQIWHLFLSQGLLFGYGLGLVFLPILPLLSQWFSRKRSFANGLAAAGSGIGGLLYSNTTRAAISSLGLKWAFIINGLVSLVVMIPAIFFLKSRTTLINANFHTFDVRFLFHPGYVWILIWAVLSMLGYVVALFTLAAYTTTGLGLSQTKGAAVQSILSAGMIFGRPLCGVGLDRFGPINGTIFFTFFSGLTSLLIWNFAHSFGVLVVFALLQGATSGIIWGGCGPITVKVLGLKDLGSALSILWIILVLPSTFSEVITLELANYSRDKLHRYGADAYTISICFGGACYIVATLVLFGAKFYVQKDWKILRKT